MGWGGEGRGGTGGETLKGGRSRPCLISQCPWSCRPGVIS